jgi:Adenylate kinase
MPLAVLPSSLTTAFSLALVLLFALTSHVHVIAVALARSGTPKYRVSFVLGGPAAGKSTVCSRLVQDYGCVHLSAGDLLRKERESGSDTAELIESYIREGAIVPVKITLVSIGHSA